LGTTDIQNRIVELFRTTGSLLERKENMKTWCFKWWAVGRHWRWNGNGHQKIVVPLSSSKWVVDTLM